MLHTYSAFFLLPDMITDAKLKLFSPLAHKYGCPLYYRLQPNEDYVAAVTIERHNVPRPAEFRENKSARPNCKCRTDRLVYTDAEHDYFRGPFLSF